MVDTKRRAFLFLHNDTAYAYDLFMPKGAERLFFLEMAEDFFVFFHNFFCVGESFTFA